MNPSKSPLKILSRAWIRVQGSDATRFLQGMWTSDIKRSAQFTGGRSAVGESLLLDVKGRAVTPAVIRAQEDQSFLVSIPAQEKQNAFDTLNHYLVADDVELILLPDDAWQVFAAPEGIPGSSDVGSWKVETSVPEAKDQLFFSRQEEWGFLVPVGALSPRHVECWVEKGKQLPFELEPLSDSEWTQRRVDAGVPEWRVDYSPDNLILEFPFSRAISFHKGCYIGQEVVARATYRGKLNRSFARFTADKDLSLGFVYSESDPSQPIGKLTTVAGKRGLGLVRLSHIEEKLFQGSGASKNHIHQVNVLA